MKRLLGKIVSLVVGVCLVLSTVIIPTYISVSSQTQQKEYKINYNPQLMSETFAGSYFAYSGSNCAVQRYNMLLSQGYTSVVSYKPEADGNLYIGGGSQNTLSPWGTLNITILENSDSSKALEFCIADNSGNILYPANNDVITIDSGSTLILSDIALSVKKDEEINFVFHGVKGNDFSIDIASYMQFASTDGAKTYATTNWRLFPVNDPVVQGTENFYFRYSSTYEKVDKNESDTGGSGSVTKYNKLKFTATEMTETVDDFPFSYNGVDCAVQRSILRVSEGYTNIVTYKAPADGKLYIGGGSANTLSPWGELHITLMGNTNSASTVEFCIADNNGNILYPAGNTVITINDANTHKYTDIALTVQKDQDINFVFHGASGASAFIDIASYMQFISTDGTKTYATTNWRLFPVNDPVVQGTEDFYFRYATDYEKIWVEPSEGDGSGGSDGGSGSGDGGNTGGGSGGGSENPPAGTDAPGKVVLPVADKDGNLPQYKIDFEAEEMTACDILDRFKWTMPSKEYICMTNPQGEKISSGGYANIVTWTAPSDGKVRIANGTLTHNNPAVGTGLFAITDKDGNVIYPTNQSLLVLDTEQNRKTGLHLDDWEMKAGDELNFIFMGVSGNTLSFNFECEMYYTDANGEKRYAYGPFCPESLDMGQHVDGYSYRYAKKFENKVIGYVTPPDTSVPGVAEAPKAREADGFMPTYKIEFDAQMMTPCNILDRFKWTMPEREYLCMTNPSGEKITSGGYANIVTWTAPSDGVAKISNGTLILHNPDAGAILFAVTDKQGNILYPTNGTFVMLDSKTARKAAIFLAGVEMKKGDELNFIFEGISGDTLSCNFECELYLTSNNVEKRYAYGPICPESKDNGQNVDGWSYRYAKTFKNVVTGYVDVKKSDVASYMPEVEGTAITVSEKDEDFISGDMMAEVTLTDTNSSKGGNIGFAEVVKSERWVVIAIIAIAAVAFIANTVVFFLKGKKKNVAHDE